MSSSQSPIGAHVLRIHGDGEMAQAIRQHPWRQTTLGGIETWPKELVVAVNMMLASHIPTTIQWGPELLVFYNDPFIPNLQGKHPQALGTPFRIVWVEAYDQVAEIFARPFRTGEAFSFPPAPFDLLVDGKLTRKYYAYAGSPVWGETADGPRVLGIYQTATDHTEEVLAKEKADRVHNELGKTLQTLQLAMETAGQASFVFDAATGLITGDATLQQLCELPGISGPIEYWIAKVHPEDQQRVAEAFASASTGQAPYDIECRIVRSDGVRWVRARATLVSEPGEPVVLTGIAEDITLRKQQSDALRQNEKLAAVGRLASSIAHEINNPLESVTNLLYLAQHTEDLHDVRNFLISADQELRRASAISSQTLRFHKQTTAPCEVFCSELFQSTLSVYEGRLKNSHIEVLKQKRATHAVECFEGEIRQVLSNLVGNAIDAMHTGGKLYIRSREACNWRTGQRGIALTVADTGTGMTPEVLACIFEAFYSTKGIGGTGLGLWISKEIVDRHRGRLLVRSSQSEKHRGTVFILLLPFHAVKR